MDTAERTKIFLELTQAEICTHTLTNIQRAKLEIDKLITYGGNPIIQIEHGEKKATIYAERWDKKGDREILHALKPDKMPFCPPIYLDRNSNDKKWKIVTGREEGCSPKTPDAWKLTAEGVNSINQKIDIDFKRFAENRINILDVVLDRDHEFCKKFTDTPNDKKYTIYTDPRSIKNSEYYFFALGDKVKLPHAEILAHNIKLLGTDVGIVGTRLNFLEEKVEERLLGLLDDDEKNVKLFVDYRSDLEKIIEGDVFDTISDSKLDSDKGSLEFRRGGRLLDKYEYKDYTFLGLEGKPPKNVRLIYMPLQDRSAGAKPTELSKEISGIAKLIIEQEDELGGRTHHSCSWGQGRSGLVAAFKALYRSDTDISYYNAKKVLFDLVFDMLKARGEDFPEQPNQLEAIFEGIMDLAHYDRERSQAQEEGPFHANTGGFGDFGRRPDESGSGGLGLDGPAPGSAGDGSVTNFRG